MLIEEEYFERHIRGIKIEFRTHRFYSIDVYYKLQNCKYDCFDSIEIDGYELCYVSLGKCVGVVVRIRDKNVEELVSLRLKSDLSNDPAEGSVKKAREICLNEAKKFLESGCNEV